MKALRLKRLAAPLLLILFLLAPALSAGATDTEAATPGASGAPAAAPAAPAAPSTPAAPAAPTNAPAISQIAVLKGYPAGSELPVLLLIQFPDKPPWGPPVTVEAAPQDGVVIDRVGFRPAPGEDKAGRRLLCRLVMKTAPDAKPGPRTLAAVLNWSLADQPDQPPRKHEFSFSLEVIPAGTKPELAASPKMLAALGLNVQGAKGSEEAAPPAPPAPKPAQASAGAAAGQDDPFAHKSTLWVLVAVFLAGLGLNLTPCVYPLIPITVSFFGGREGSGRGALIMSAVAYLAGMAVMYSVLGSVVALGGGMLGAALTHPVVTLVIVAILLALAASMFGLWEIRLPAGLNRLAASNRAGVVGALLMGLTVGLLAAPCVGPFVVGLMVHVGKVGEVAYGFAVFLVLSLGLGLPLTVLAVFSGSLERLPGSGMWMIWVRKFFGVVLVLMAVYMAEPLLGPLAYNYLMALAALGGGAYLALSDKSGSARFKVFQKLAALALVAAVGLFLWFNLPPAKVGKVEWTAYRPAVLAQAHQSGKPTLVLFTADWCPPCKKLKAETFPDARVSQTLAGINTIKVDLTSNPPEDDKNLARKHGVRGVPTMLVFDAGGKWREDLTMVGFVSPSELLTNLGAAKGK